MAANYDIAAPKKATNLTLNEDLVRTAKRLEIPLSSVTEAALVKAVKEKLAEQWLAENGDAISEYNKMVERDGVFSDSVRLF